METKPDNPWAFPVLQGLERYDSVNGEHGYSVVSSSGMSLRDYFAGQALAGPCIMAIIDPSGREVYDGSVARVAYNIADAMLKAREAK